LATASNEYGVFRETIQGNSAAGYLVNPTPRTTLIDQQGNLHVLIGFDTSAKDTVLKLNLLLADRSYQ